MTVPSNLVWASLRAFLIALVLTPIVRDVFRAYNVVDRPGRRKVHAYPIPRVGGVPISIAWASALLFLFHTNTQYHSTALMLLPGAALIFLTGFLDDFLTLKPTTKLLGQIAAAAVVSAAGVRVEVLGGLTLPFWLSLGVTIAWLLLATNALNLIDGLDGLCAGMAFLGSLTFFAAGAIRHDVALMYAALPLAGALLGFLVFNINPATVFLGDSGALTIGFLLGCQGIMYTGKTATFGSALVPVLALSIPLIDVSLSIGRRFLKRQKIFSADRGHIHHRLLDRGLSPRRASLALYFMALPGIVAALLLTSDEPRLSHRVAVAVFLLVVVTGIWHLRYAEFEVAARLLFRGEFRRTVALKVRMEEIRAAFGRAGSDDEWWGVLLDAAREAGWVRIAWAGIFNAREHVLIDALPAWSFTIQLNDRETISIDGGAAAAASGFDLPVFSAILRATLPANRLELSSRTLS